MAIRADASPVTRPLHTDAVWQPHGRYPAGALPTPTVVLLLEDDDVRAIADRLSRIDLGRVGVDRAREIVRTHALWVEELERRAAIRRQLAPVPPAPAPAPGLAGDGSTRPQTAPPGGRPHLRTVVKFLLLALCWGSSFLWIKYGLRGFPPSVVLFLQCAGAAALLWGMVALFALAGRTPDADRDRVGGIARSCVVGVLTIGGWGLIVWGEQYIDSGIAAVLIAAEPLWTFALVRMLIGRVGTAVNVIGIVLGIVGVAMLSYAQGTMTGDIRTVGMVALVVAALLYALMTVFVARALADVWSVRIAAWSMTWSAIFALPLALVRFGQVTMRTDAVIALVLLAVFDAAVGYFLYYRLTHEIGPVRVAQVNYLLPIIALVWGVMLLHERLHLLSAVAVAIVLVGTWLGARGAFADVGSLLATWSSGPDGRSVTDTPDWWEEAA